ncbi:MAG: hypothetical protein U1E70_05625 [Acetobacteraceae bacterium]
MPDQLPSLLSAVVADGFNLQQWQAGSILGAMVGAALTKLMHNRLEAARAIFLEELRAGEVSLPPSQIDEGVAILCRYLRAAQEGTARRNLRLMAKVIAGQARLGNLWADEFLHDADMIASLRREEIILLATVHQIWASDWLKDKEEGEKVGAAFARASTQLSPSLFRDAEEMEATAASLTRTGLLVSVSLWGPIGYRPTPKLERLVSLAPLSEVLAQEEGGVEAAS